jgi:hypothetical protein
MFFWMLDEEAPKYVQEHAYNMIYHGGMVVPVFSQYSKLETYMYSSA